MTVKEFCEKYRIKARSVRISDNPNIPDWKDADHYAVTLESTTPGFPSNRAFNCFFSKGYGRGGEPPKAAEVLSCLLVDAQCVGGYDFNEFCASLGYNPASRRAENIYSTVVHQTEALKSWMGKLWDEFLECEEY